MGSGTLLIRADASVAIGTGHVMRCLALAQAWQDAGGRAVFAMARPLPAMRDRLLSEKMEVVALQKEAGSVEDAARAVELARQCDAAWVVVDGYHFGGDYQRQLKSAGLRLLFVDDNGHADSYSADAILNQNVHAYESLYARRETYTRLLLGPRYAMLRREFQARRGWVRTIPPQARRILVSMGGSDPENVTARVIPALASIPGNEIEVRVIVGGSNPHARELRRVVADAGGRFYLLQDVTDMADLLAWADVIVAAAGSICWEICAMGLPAVLLTIAENQKQVTRQLAEIGAALTLSSGQAKIEAELAPVMEDLLRSETHRAELSARARQIVDGNGTRRVLEALQEIVSPNL